MRRRPGMMPDADWEREQRAILSRLDMRTLERVLRAEGAVAYDRTKENMVRAIVRKRLERRRGVADERTNPDSRRTGKRQDVKLA